MTAILTPATTSAPAARPAAGKPRTFRTDIEGLRAVAVLTVVLFHAHVPGFGGGYVGVDIFFVISGFLITGLMIDESVRTGRVSLSRFYARRARRILPAACVVLVAVLVVSRWLFTPLRQIDVVKDTVASAFYLSNWRFIELQTDYMQAGRAESPLLHYWSLAVEEQFYLVWPLLVILAGALVAAMARRGRGGWPAPDGHRRSLCRTVLAFAAVAGVASFALSLVHTTSDPTLAYMGSPERAWEFALGAVLAAAVRLDLLPRHRALAALFGWAGLALLIYATVTFSNATPFPGTAALYPVVGTALVIAAGAMPAFGGPARWLLLGSLLSLRPVRFLGRISFSLYLWHWPVLVFAAALWPDLTWQQEVGLMVLAVLPAWLTMVLVEDPLRTSAVVSALPRRGLALGVSAMGIPVLAGLLLGTQAVFLVEGPGTPASAAPASVKQPFAADTRTAGAVVPAPGRARLDYPGYPDRCEANDGEENSAECILDPIGGGFAMVAPTRVILIGDSHAGHLYEAVKAFAVEKRLTLQVLIKSGCPVSTVRSQGVTQQTQENCERWRANTIADLKAQPKAEYLFVSELHRNGTVAENWTPTIDAFRQIAGTVVYVEDTPFPQKDVPECISGRLDDWSKCALSRSASLWPDAYLRQQKKDPTPGVVTVGLNDLLCPASYGQSCPVVRGGTLLYRDNSHLTRTATLAMEPAFVARVEEALEKGGG